jgi:hypothetical protein
MRRLGRETVHKFSTNLSTKNPPVRFANHFPNHILCRIWRTSCHIVDESNSSLEVGRGRPKDCRHRLSSWLPAAWSPCKLPHGSHSLPSHKHTRILTTLLLYPSKKVQESRNRLGVAQWVPGVLGPQISWHSACEGGEVVSLTHWPPLPPGNVPGTHFH